MKYSERLGSIDDKSFQQVLSRFDLGEFVSAKAIPYGLFGQNVFLASTKGEFVFRGNPLLDGQFETERFMAERLRHETGSPVPWPYLFDGSKDFFAWPYVIMPRLVGQQLASPEVKAALSDQDRLGVAEALGVNLARMHQLRHPHPGTYDPLTDTIRRMGEVYIPPWEQTADNWHDADPTPLSTGEIYQRWIYSRIGYFLKRAVEANDSASDRSRMTTPEDVAWVESILETHRAALLVPFQACFVMNDYKEANTVADKINGRWQITGVFDLMEAYFGDPEADLARTTMDYWNDKSALTRPTMDGWKDRNGYDPRLYAFLNAYFQNRKDPARPGFQGRFAIYTLMDRMLLWSYGRGLGWFDAFSSLRSWFELQLSLDLRQLLIE